jgi:Protein of unknown function (DUF3618)
MAAQRRCASGTRVGYGAMAYEESLPAASKPNVVDLQAEIAAARAELAASLAALKSQASTGALVKRGGRAITGLFTDGQGGVRPERIAIVGAVVVGVVALSIMTRRRR